MNGINGNVYELYMLEPPVHEWVYSILGPLHLSKGHYQEAQHHLQVLYNVHKY